MLTVASLLAAMTIAGAFWVGVLAARRLRDWGEGRRAIDEGHAPPLALAAASGAPPDDPTSRRVRELVAERLSNPRVRPGAIAPRQLVSADAGSRTELGLGTLRQGDVIVVEAADAGADGITAHLREDRRHISDKDIERLIEEIKLPLNLEMAATEEMLEIALRHTPHAVCLVPEKREERTTEGGLDVAAQHRHLNPYVEKLSAAGCRVSLFIEAEEVQIAFAEQESTAFVSGDGVNKPRGFLTYTTVADSAWSWGNVGYIASGAAGASGATSTLSFNST